MDDPLEQYKDLLVKDSTKAQLSVFEFTATRYFKISRLRQLPAAGKVVCKVPEGIQTSAAPRSWVCASQLFTAGFYYRVSLSGFDYSPQVRNEPKKPSFFPVVRAVVQVGA